MRFERLDDHRWIIPKTGGMNVEGIIYGDHSLLEHASREKAAEQVMHVAHLPGIVGRSMAMPDIHWGYGFPIGGAAAMDADQGVISPGGIGYDISCGVRLIRTNLVSNDLTDRIPCLLDGLFHNVPAGVGATGKIRLSLSGIKAVFDKGASWAIAEGYGEPDDLLSVEDGGRLDSADPDGPSPRAVERGREQLGTLGSGNHFLEIQEVVEIFNERAADAFGLFPGQITVMVHTGSRGCGYQVCEDFLNVMQGAVRRYGISVPDRQLCCAPIHSQEGRAYFSAMSAAANYAKANRQVITHWIRETFMRLLDMSPRDLGMGVVYDVCHNIGKMETHTVDGKQRRLCVHRKGATRSFPAGHPDVPLKYRSVGQPVLIPGTMGTSSYVLVGTESSLSETFGTTCHGAGRMMSRKAALQRTNGHALRDELQRRGILVRTASYKGLAEEAPEAYKDVDNVVEVCQRAGLSRKVARLRPLGVVKG